MPVGKSHAGAMDSQRAMRNYFGRESRIMQSKGHGGMATVGGIAAERLKQFIERIERLEEEKKALSDDVKDVYAEAKAVGFDPKVMRQVVKLRKLDKDDRQEQEALLETYLHALGMDGTPLGDAATDREARVAQAVASPGVRRAFKDFAEVIPPGGSMTIGMQGQPGTRISRDADGALAVEDEPIIAAG